MSYEDKVYDPDGERIVKGSCVETEWFDDEDGERAEHHWLGTVDHITDSDQDVDDEGRPYGIAPKVFVQWDAEFADPGDLEGFSTHGRPGWYDRATGDGDDGWYECDELKVVK